MPALHISRQPEVLAWFGTARGQPLLAAENGLIRAALASRPTQQPWLWLAPLALPADAAHAPRGLRLHRQGDVFAGSLRCGLPLPLPTEAIGSIVLQHVLEEDGMDDLLEECARILEPGGRLWLFALNPWSPYRARWRRSGLATRDAQAWRHSLRETGLQPCGGEVSYLGPVWRMSAAASQARVPGRLRAVCLLEAEKRVAALIPPAPVQRQWHAGAAPA
jgi:SAM-dependent methyltransferase